MGGNKRNNRHHTSNPAHHQTKGNNHKNSRERHEGDPFESANNNDYENDENLDFCQRFFGDPLFSNLNVALLFLIATFLPMIVWIPHFASEYRRLRQQQYLEEQQQIRMQKARLATQQQQQQATEFFQKYTKEQQPSVVATELPASSSSSASAASASASLGENEIVILEDDIYYLNQKSTAAHILSPSSSSSSHDRPLKPFKPVPRTILPALCPDGITMGYDDWFTLRDAISEANANAAEDFLRWNEFLVSLGKAGQTFLSYSKMVENQASIFQPPDPFVICPGVTLTQKSSLYRSFSLFGMATYLSWFIIQNPLLSPILPASLQPPSSQSANTAYRPRSSLSNKSKNSPIFINAEDITIECEMCTVDCPGSHFSFGPHAKNVLVKGITFRGATTSSLTFHQHGADASFQDCYWLYNSGGVIRNNIPHASINSDTLFPPNGNGPGALTHAGAVADLNSTSTVTFFRCVIDDQRQNPKRANVGAGVANVPGMNPPAGHLGGGTGPGGSNGFGGGSSVSSSLTIRN